VDIHDDVWFSMTNIFKVGKFDQATQTITEYDLPTPRTIIRFIYADHEGNIWFPNNNNNKIGVIVQIQDPQNGPIIEVPSPQAALPLTSVVIGIAAAALVTVAVVAVILFSRKRQ